MLEQARAAEAAGFDGTTASDHWAPWFPEGRGSSAWAFLGAAGQHTTGPLGTSVTPLVHHYHPGVVAQFFMSLEDLYPGRVFLGAGSGEALNEVPLGLDWPSVSDQQDRLEQALDAITRLWDGETVTVDAGWFRLEKAKLYSRAKNRPKLYVSAFGEHAVEIAAKYGDGLWTLGDPEQAPAIVERWKEERGKLGRDTGEIIFQSGFHLGPDEKSAIESSRKWKPTQMPEVYTDDIHDPAEMVKMADEQMSRRRVRPRGLPRRRRPGRARRPPARDARARADRRVPAGHRRRRPARLDPPLRRGSAAGASRRARLSASPAARGQGHDRDARAGQDEAERAAARADRRAGRVDDPGPRGERRRARHPDRRARPARPRRDRTRTGRAAPTSPR